MIQLPVQYRMAIRFFLRTYQSGLENNTTRSLIFVQTNHPFSLSNNVQVTSFCFRCMAWRIRKPLWKIGWRKGLSNLKFRLSYGSLVTIPLGTRRDHGYANKPKAPVSTFSTLNNALIFRSCTKPDWPIRI